jgi:predicted amidohydrolase
MTSGADPGANVTRAAALVREAASRGARLVVLPEKWNAIVEPERDMQVAEPLDGPTLRAVRGWAAELGVAIVAGSILERAPGDALRARNTSVLIDPEGAPVAVYRKLHLFDVDVAGRSYRESDGAAPGDSAVTGGVLGLRIGLSVCYDLRFPELYRLLTLDGAQVLCVPAAFTEATGRDHWEPLLRARAIENQAFVLAAGQVGRHSTGNVSHGRSMIVDPWGVVLAQAPDREGVVVADLHLGELRRVRESLPALRHRRADVYGSPSPG